MKIRQLIPIKLIGTIILLLLALLTNAQTSPTVYVALDGTGDYNCNGTNDQEEINQALDFVASNPNFTTVFLKSGTYTIDNPVFISGNTILEGNSDAVIKLIDNANWNTQFKPLIGQKGIIYEMGQGDTITTSNIIIRGFEINGNREHQTEPSGHSYYNAVRLINCRNITINDMYIHDCLAEGVQIGYQYYGFNVQLDFFNNRIHNSGHDGIYVTNCINFIIHNNIFTDNRTDAHIRAQDCNHFKIFNNICGNNPNRRNSGGTGVYIQANGTNPLNDAEIYNNYLYGKGAFNGIWLWHETREGELNTHKNVYIHHNIISGYQASGIGILGFNKTLIENNVIECNGIGNNHSYTDNVLFGRQSGITFYKGDPKKKIKGFKTYVRNNIIIYNAAYGIRDKKPNIHEFISEYNCFYGNEKGNYKNASSNTDIYVYPDIACNYDYDNNWHWYNKTTQNILSAIWTEADNDPNVYSSDMGANEALNYYHLKSKEGRWDGQFWVYDDVTSFCINTGNPSSNYYNEPLPNGYRINIGAFGDTEIASKSNISPDIYNFMAYPNPTTGIITISEEFINNEYYIYNLEGRLVKFGKLNSSQIIISDLSNGIYLLKIKEYKSDNYRKGKIVKID